VAKESEMPKVALDSLGCKLNQAEIELLARQFAEAGYRLVAPSAEADVYILNTCTVTHVADRKSRHRLRMARRRSPGVYVVATGCYAERAPQELSRIEGVDLVLNNEQKPQLLQLLEESGCLKRPAVQDASGRRAVYRTRAFVKIVPLSRFRMAVVTFAPTALCRWCAVARPACRLSR